MSKNDEKNSLTTNSLNPQILDAVPPENVQDLINYQQKVTGWQIGIFGKIFGTNQASVSKFITFIIVLIFCIIIAVDYFVSLVENRQFNDGLLKYLLPIISLSIGYLFGKN